jgi:hypothetical protein
MRIAIACIALLTIAATSFAQPAPFEPPPAGRVISGWGGEGDADLAAYDKIVAPHPPAMISFYVAVDSAQVAKFMLRYREFASRRGFFIAQIGLYFRGAEHDVATGMRDPDLLVLADGLRDVGRPVLLRIGYEFNNPDALYEPSAYIGAFRHATDVLRKDKVNFATVWDATAYGFSDPHYMKWYPGDDVVDWWEVDFADAKDFSRAESKAFLDVAAHHRKPVVVSVSLASAKSDADALKYCAASFDLIRTNSATKALTIRPTMRLSRWPKTAAYVKQQLADPRFIDATEAPALFRPPRSDE